MTKEGLDHNLKIFFKEIEERLETIDTDAEKQQYLEGMVHAFDAVQRYAHAGDLTPLERENFIGSMKSNMYSKAYHMKLDPETYMRELVESDAEGKAISYLFAKEVHDVLGIPIDDDDYHNLMNVGGLYAIKSGMLDKKPEQIIEVKSLDEPNHLEE